MINKPSHTVTVTVTGNYTHGESQHATVTVSGDGGIEHMLDAFKSALVASGFALDTAKRLDEVMDV